MRQTSLFWNLRYSAPLFQSLSVRKSEIITEKRVQEGDVLIGLPSSGIHSNGFSLVRKIVFEVKGYKGDERMTELDGKTLGEVLLTPTRLYPRVCLPLIRDFRLHGMVHITGGGFYDNIPRALPDGFGVEIDTSAWDMPPIFKLLQEWGGVEWPEMYRTFNMGVGMILMVGEKDADAVTAALEKAGETSYRIGRVTRSGEVVLKGGVFHG